MIAYGNGIIAHEIHQSYLYIALIHSEIRRTLREITAVEEQEVGILLALKVEESHAAHETSASSLCGVAEIRAVWIDLRVGVVGVIDGDGLVLLRLGDGEDGNHDKEYGGNLFHVLFSYGYSSIQFSFSFLALSGELLEVIDDDKSEIVALVGQHLTVGAKREGRHTVVALREIVDGGDAVFGFRIDWLKSAFAKLDNV